MFLDKNIITAGLKESLLLDFIDKKDLILNYVSLDLDVFGES